MKIFPGDTFLICSDGLSGQMSDLDIRKVVDEKLRAGRDPQATVKTLIEIANQNGGDDNITSLVVEVLTL